MTLYIPVKYKLERPRITSSPEHIAVASKSVKMVFTCSVLDVVGHEDQKYNRCLFCHIVQVDKQEKKKKKTGRAKRRIQYNRRFVNVVPTFGKKKGPNANS